MKGIYQLLPFVLGLGLLGCNDTSKPEPVSEAKTEEKTTSVETFESKLPDSAPTIKVSTSSVLPPFSLNDEYGILQGIDIDVIRAIGENKGFKVELYDDDWGEMFNNVEAGKRDLAISGISYKKDRAEKYALSDPYFFNPSAIMYTDTKLTINGRSDLKGLRVASTVGSRQLKELKESEEYSELIEADTIFLTYQKLIQDKADAVVLDKLILEYTAANNPDYKVQIIATEDKSSSASNMVIMVDQENTELLETINAGIAELKANGEIKKIEEKWLSN